MRASYFAWGIALALVLALSLIVNAPARLLGLVVPSEQVLLQGLAGTLWQGSASRCLLQLPQGYLHLGAVRWSLHPLSLVRFAPRLTLSSEWGEQVVGGDVVLRGASGVDLMDFEARASADLVRQFAPLAVDGRISAQLGHLLLRDGLPYAGEGRLVWENGGFQSPQGRVALGTYALDFLQEAGGPLRGQVLTLAGNLEAQGDVELRGRAYSIDLLLGGAATRDAQLKDALALMAAPEGDGYRISLDGEF